MILSQEKKNIDLAINIRQALTPDNAQHIKGIEFSALFKQIPSIGSDLHDIIVINDDLIGFYVCDVCNSGISSALISLFIKQFLTNHMLLAQTPKTILSRINNKLCQTISDNCQITIFLAFLDLHNNKLTYCNIGHSAPLLVRSGKKNVDLIGIDSALGLLPDITIKNKTIYLLPDDWILLYSRGYCTLFSSDNINFHDSLHMSVESGIIDTPQKAFLHCQKNFDRIYTENKQTQDITLLTIGKLTQSRRNKIKMQLGFLQNTPVYLQAISYYEEMDSVSYIILKDMDEAGFCDDSIRKMKLTIIELIANAIEHGNIENHTKKVIVGHHVESSMVDISIMDCGDGFDPDSVPDPTIPENLIKDHGRGLFIVRDYVDKIMFNKKGNRVLIRKYRKGQCC